MLAAHDFLMPWFVNKAGKSYYLQKKDNWKELKVGFNNNQIRFNYAMDTQINTVPGWETADVESKNFMFFNFEVCHNFTFCTS